MQRERERVRGREAWVRHTITYRAANTHTHTHTHTHTNTQTHIHIHTPSTYTHTHTVLLTVDTYTQISTQYCAVFADQAFSLEGACPFSIPVA